MDGEMENDRRQEARHFELKGWVEMVSDRVRRKHEETGGQHDDESGARPWGEVAGKLRSGLMPHSEPEQAQVDDRDRSNQ
jgi:hypothetical protein